MSGNSKDLTASKEKNKLGPDMFGFYAREAAELLSQDDGLLPFPHQSSHLTENICEVGRGKGKTKNSCRTEENNGIIVSASLFSDGLGAQVSEFKKERLKALLSQSVFSLTQEVDELINPVRSVCRIRSCLRYKERLLSRNASACKDDQLQHPQKKQKVSPVYSETNVSDDVMKKCAKCHSTGNLQSRSGPDGTKMLCNVCGLGKNLNNGSTGTSNVEVGVESDEIDDDLKFILENDSSQVEELLKKHSDELSDTLNHMEQKLEELINITMTTCRPMAVTEKQHLRKLIQNLPSSHLDGVVEIIGQSKPLQKSSPDEVYVDLDEQDNVTLWRLYFYVQTSNATQKQ